MDFLDLCQGLGLALAAGLVIGAVLPPIMPTWGVLAGAAPLAVVVCGLSLDSTGEPVWPAILIGVLGGGLAAVVSQGVVSGASRRQAQAGSAPGRPAASQPGSAGVTAIVVLAAIVLAGLSLLAPPVSLVAAAALAWIWVGRRQREQRKHEGLRVLR